MTQVTFSTVTDNLINQLELTLGKLAVAADAKINTSNLESKAQKLASKIKASYELYGNLPIYTDIKGAKIYSWDVDRNLPDNIFMVYADLCKRCSEALEVIDVKGIYYAKIADEMFVNLNELPSIPIPEFKVKIEGNTLMAIRSDLMAKLPKETQKLLENGVTNE